MVGVVMVVEMVFVEIVGWFTTAAVVGAVTKKRFSWGVETITHFPFEPQINQNTYILDHLN